MLVIVEPALLQKGVPNATHAHGSVLGQPAPLFVQPAPPAPSQNACHASHWSAGSAVDAPVHAATSREGWLCSSSAEEVWLSSATSASPQISFIFVSRIQYS
jgi:hypothetical protein